MAAAAMLYDIAEHSFGEIALYLHYVLSYPPPQVKEWHLGLEFLFWLGKEGS